MTRIYGITVELQLMVGSADSTPGGKLYNPNFLPVLRF